MQLSTTMLGITTNLKPHQYMGILGEIIPINGSLYINPQHDIMKNPTWKRALEVLATNLNGIPSTSYSMKSIVAATQEAMKILPSEELKMIAHSTTPKWVHHQIMDDVRLHAKMLLESL